MNEGIDTTRPVQLRPNGPDKRTAYAVLKSDGFLHVVDASVWRYEGGMMPVGTLEVHIGCSTLITDMVRDGESEWDAIRRVVTTWQQEQRDADHAEALAMVAPVDANGVTYTPGCEVESVSRARAGARRGQPLSRGMVMKIENGRPVVSFYGEGDVLDDVRPDCFVITSQPVETAAPVAPMIKIGSRFEEERYTMRGTLTRPSDRVHSWYRRINGNLFGFCRMYWAEEGVTTLTVYRGRSTERLHHWVSAS